jgi:hypothetical protein
MEFTRIFLAVLMLASLATILAAENAQPPDHGALASTLQPFVNDQLISGAVALVANKNRVLGVKTVGTIWKQPTP